MKPFSAYPEDRVGLLELAEKVVQNKGTHPDPERLADWVQAVLKDEQWGRDNGVWENGGSQN
jgi:hypothetical protein